MSDASINAILSQIRSLQGQMQVRPAPTEAPPAAATRTGADRANRTEGGGTVGVQAVQWHMGRNSGRNTGRDSDRTSTRESAPGPEAPHTED